jgi:hypothetical protein
MSGRLSLSPPIHRSRFKCSRRLWTGVAVQDETCRCVHWIWWRTFTLNITVFNATLSTSVFTLVLHVSTTLGHHQVLLLLLLQLFHCNFTFIYAHLFICLMLCLTFYFPHKSPFPCLTRGRHEGVWGSGCIDPHFLDFCISWRWMVNFSPSCFTAAERAPGTHWIGGWVDPRAGLDNMEKWKFLPPPGLELRPLGRAARSQPRYRLRYPGSHLTYSLFNLPLTFHFSVWILLQRKHF